VTNTPHLATFVHRGTFLNDDDDDDDANVLRPTATVDVRALNWSQWNL